MLQREGTLLSRSIAFSATTEVRRESGKSRRFREDLVKVEEPRSVLPHIRQGGSRWHRIYRRGDRLRHFASTREMAKSISAPVYSVPSASSLADMWED